MLLTNLRLCLSGGLLSSFLPSVFLSNDIYMFNFSPFVLHFFGDRLCGLVVRVPHC
jgi:hypothetical protein